MILAQLVDVLDESMKELEAQAIASHGVDLTAEAQKDTFNVLQRVALLLHLIGDDLVIALKAIVVLPSTPSVMLTLLSKSVQERLQKDVPAEVTQALRGFWYIGDLS